MKHRFILSISILILIGIFFKPIVFSPNSYILTNSGDGLKNYFTAAYYIRYDSGSHFSGLQAPYGNHIVYTDNQPLLSIVLKQIDQHVFPVAEYTVGIFNYTMLLSIWLTALLLYAILIRCNLDATYSVVFALLITCMSPQIYRIGVGHYALSYSCFVPLLWYQLLLLNPLKPAWYRLCLLFCTLLLFGLLHPYYLLIGTVFLLAYAFVFFVQHYSTLRSYRLYLICVFFTSLLPLVVFQGWIKLTDTVKDRPENPWGLMDYRAVFEGLFLPISGPLNDATEWIMDNAFMKLFFNMNYQSTESNSYLGLSCLVIMLFIVARMITLIRRKQSLRILHPVLPKPLQTAAWAGFLVLLFSMAYPFRLGMEFLLDIFTPLKQFRSLGRFAWVFYYTFAVTCACYLQLVTRTLRIHYSAKVAFRLSACLLALWTFEAGSTLYSAKPPYVDNGFSKTPVESLNIDTAGLHLDHYQSIVTLPLFLAGTEKNEIDADLQTKQSSVVLAYKSGVPLTSGDMSRVSIKAGQRIRQLLSGDLIYKEIFKDLTDKRPLLIMTHKKRLKKEEVQLLSHCKLLTKKGIYFFYELKPSIIDSITTASRKALLPQNNKSHISTKRERAVLYKNFNAYSSQDAFAGQGAFLLSNHPELELFHGKLPDSTITQWEISFWHQINYTLSGTSIFTFEWLAPDGSILSKEENYLSSNFDLVNGWILIKQKLLVSDPQAILRIYGNDGELLVDELLIRPQTTNVYTHTPGEGSFFNNYPLEK